LATARNLLIDRVRHEQIVPIEAVSDLDALGVAGDDPGPERSAVARDELRLVQAALDRLPPRQREAVFLRQVEGLSRREIAQRMGIGEETVKDHLAEGLFDLAEILFGEPPNLRRRK
jgi:RNA polymerase sigma-70 factor (ECF subfamily)